MIADYEGVAVAVPVTIPYARQSGHGVQWWLGRALAALVARYLLVETRSSQAEFVIPDHLAHADPVVERFECWARSQLAKGFSLAEAASAATSAAGSACAYRRTSRSAPWKCSCPKSSCPSAAYVYGTLSGLATTPTVATAAHAHPGVRVAPPRYRVHAAPGLTVHATGTHTPFSLGKNCRSPSPSPKVLSDGVVRDTADLLFMIHKNAARVVP